MMSDTSASVGRYNVLVEFAHKHPDFQRAELESVLGMYGIQLGSEDCQVLPLPNQLPSSTTEEAQQSSKTIHYTKTSKQKAFCRPFLILSFRRPEKNSVGNASDNNNTMKYHLEDDKDALEQTQTTSVPISAILARCTLVRSAVELWGVGTTIENCAKNVQEWSTTTAIGRECHTRHASTRQEKENSWKMTVHTLGAKYNREEQDEMRKAFAFLNFAGPVRMKDPTNEFLIVREIELDILGSPRYPRHSMGKVLIPENDARPPMGVYFGRVLGGMRKVKGRGGIDEYSLNKRSYLGPTSMDAELSLIMTNLGQVQKSSFCMDPFVGTGSILLTCALRGAYCMGTDIDIRVLRGRSEKENVWTNFRQFQLPRPDLVRSDNAIYHRHFHRSNVPLYDVIICDPPYGIRAGARKSGSKKEGARPIPEDQRHDHIPQTKPYPVSDVMADLLNMAARTLVLNGRLVYIIPSMTDFDETTDLPRHECLKLVHTCYQPLSIELGRRIVTMQKIKNYDDSQNERYLTDTWVNGPESAEKCANIRDRLIEAAKLKPGYQEKAEYRKQKRKETKIMKKKAKRESAGTC